MFVQCIRTVAVVQKNESWSAGNQYSPEVNPFCSLLLSRYRAWVVVCRHPPLTQWHCVSVGASQLISMFTRNQAILAESGGTKNDLVSPTAQPLTLCSFGLESRCCFDPEWDLAKQQQHSRRSRERQREGRVGIYDYSSILSKALVVSDLMLKVGFVAQKWGQSVASSHHFPLDNHFPRSWMNRYIPYTPLRIPLWIISGSVRRFSLGQDRKLG
jgi:hypothetical protein